METLSGDLIFIQDLARFNSGYAYILNVSCIFSNKIWAFPLKRKTKAETEENLDKVFSIHHEDISNFWSDKGGELADLSIYKK